jgi:hypothetical protein
VRGALTVLGAAVVVLAALFGAGLYRDIQSQRADDVAARVVAADARHFADEVGTRTRAGQLSDQDLAPLSRSDPVSVRTVERAGGRISIVFQVVERYLPMVPGPRYGCYRLSLTAGTSTVDLARERDCPDHLWSPSR